MGLSIPIIGFVIIILILVLSICAFSVPAMQVTVITQAQRQIPYQETVTAPVQVAYQETT